MEMNLIKELVEKETGIDITEKTHKRPVVYARAMYFKLCRDKTNHNLHEIGESVGRHHTSVLHAIREVWPEAMAYNEDFRFTYDRLKEDEKMLSWKERYFKLKKEYMELHKFYRNSKTKNTN